MRIYFIRHGETDTNVSGKLHSSGDLRELNETGIEQMKKVSGVLKKVEIERIYSSKEKRAVESAKILSDVIGKPVIQIEGMQERNWGEFTGKPWSEVAKVLEPMSLQERYEYIPENGESWREFEERLIKTLNKIVYDNNGGNIAIVTHGGAIRALMPYLLGTGREESYKYDPDNASITVFDLKKGKFYPVVVNDLSHLR